MACSSSPLRRCTLAGGAFGCVVAALVRDWDPWAQLGAWLVLFLTAISISSRATSTGASPGPRSATGNSTDNELACPGLVSFYVTTPIYYVNAAPHLGHA